MYNEIDPDSATAMATAEANIRHDYALLLQNPAISLTVTALDHAMPSSYYIRYWGADLSDCSVL